MFVTAVCLLFLTRLCSKTRIRKALTYKRLYSPPLRAEWQKKAVWGTGDWFGSPLLGRHLFRLLSPRWLLTTGLRLDIDNTQVMKLHVELRKIRCWILWTTMLKCKIYNNELRRCKQIKTSMLKSTITTNIKSTMPKTAIEFWRKLYAIFYDLLFDYITSNF